MRAIFLIVCCLGIIACGPNDNPEGCTLDSVVGKPYVGFARLCNGIPGQQQDFPAEAFLMINDTILNFQIASLDTSISFEHKVSVFFECVLSEDRYRHILYDTMSNEVLGSIGLNKTSISLQLVTNPCLDNGSFEGVLE